MSNTTEERVATTDIVQSSGQSTAVTIIALVIACIVLTLIVYFIGKARGRAQVRDNMMNMAQQGQFAQQAMKTFFG